MNKPKELPIDRYQKEILTTIKENPVTIITAQTGAGKSTRVPLWFYQKNKRVVVTQPRRIAARSLADYVAKENQVKLGSSIGYQTGFDRKISSQTTLRYITDGVQILKEIKKNTNYDLLIIDEVHEWNLNQEVLTGMVKINLDQGVYSKNNQRVVIMSATLDATHLSSFLDNAPIISVEGRGYPVSYNQHTQGFMLSDTVAMIREDLNVLVFLPGKKEIEDFSELLKDTLKEDKLKARIFPLHSELSLKEQALVFKHYDSPKVVASTDVAQTSLTIDDIDSVIDSGLKKEIRYLRGVEGLYPVEISAAECEQRAGRGGRTKRGYYILCSSLGIKEREKFSKPEIKRLNPASIVLRLKKWGFNALDFTFFHTPDRGLIKKAEEKLRIFGALDKEGHITPDGKRMANLPVSIRSARAVLEAEEGTSETFYNALKLISILEVKGIVNKEYMGQKIYKEKFNSDLYNQLMIWNNERSFKKLISYKKLTLAKQIYHELRNRLQGNIKLKNKKEGNRQILKVILSLGVDFTFKKFGKYYYMDDIERALDNRSILHENLPEMITGIPFDLVIRKPNYLKDEEEESLVLLITFATGISYDLLDNIKPFSYKKVKSGEIDQAKILIKEVVYFGGRIIKEGENPPNFMDAHDREITFKLAYDWYKNQEKELKIFPKLSSLNHFFNQLKENKILKGPLKGFGYYKKKMILQKIKKELSINDLKLFFNLSPAFQVLSLKDLLPPPDLKRIKLAQWPKVVKINQKNNQILYIKNTPFIQFDLKEFRDIQKQDLFLPSGVRANIILGKKRCYDWDEAVYYYNKKRKEEIFIREFRGQLKEADIKDLKKIPFPQEIEKGGNKENKPFKFYVTPKIIKNKVFLTHFYFKEEADRYFEGIKKEWESFIFKSNARELEDLFKNRGWD